MMFSKVTAISFSLQQLTEQEPFTNSHTPLAAPLDSFWSLRYMENG